LKRYNSQIRDCRVLPCFILRHFAAFAAIGYLQTVASSQIEPKHSTQKQYLSRKLDLGATAL